MYQTIHCPLCAASFPVHAERLGDRVRCASCGGSFAPADAIVVRPPGRPDAGVSGLARVVRGGGDASLFWSALLSAVATAVVYLGLVLPFATSFVGTMFAKGWVPIAILFLTFWSIAILLFKLVAYRTQLRAFTPAPLPHDTFATLDAEDVPAAVEHIVRLPVAVPQSFLLGRLVRGLEYFRARPDPEGVADVLHSQAELDSSSVETSYSFVRVLIWAVPILGFIGTVLGIGEAVRMFSDSIGGAPDVESIKESLGEVTEGLGFAFDTTLIALIASILLMIPTNWLQKLEEELLVAVSDYCHDDFLHRLVASIDERPEIARYVKEAVSEVMEHQDRRLTEWTDTISRVGHELLEDGVRAWADLGARLERRADDHARRMESELESRASRQLEQLDRWAEEIASSHARAQREAGEALTGAGEALARLLDGFDQVQRSQEQRLSSLRETTDAARAALTDFAASMTDIREDFRRHAEEAIAATRGGAELAQEVTDALTRELPGRLREAVSAWTDALEETRFLVAGVQSELSQAELTAPLASLATEVRRLGDKLDAVDEHTRTGRRSLRSLLRPRRAEES